MIKAIKHLFIAFLIGLILCPPSMALAGGITPDAAAPAANQATMDAAPNGVPVVNIVAPQGGMSHNKFSDFNVGTQGVILNNGVAPGVSQLGGALAPNPNFHGQAASTILNEVTGTGRTSINGYTEIFGQSANYVLSNPNGISINGGGFINTPRATLTTGVPQYSGGAFQGIDVRTGDVLVEGAGVNANNIDAFAIVTRATRINAAIYAKALHIVTGQNRLNPATGATTPLAPDGSAAPSVAIDSSALGGMYAGRITLVGTEAGVGVNTLGPVQATDHLEMTADGKIQIKGTVSSGNDLALTSASGEVAVSGKVRAAGTATLTGQTVTVAKEDADDAAIVSADTMVVNGGTLNNAATVAGDSRTVIATNAVTNTGTIYSGGTALFRIGDTLYNNQGVILAKGDMVLEGATDGSRMATLQNDSGNIESLDGGLTFRAGTFVNNNSHFTLVEGAEELGYSEGGYWYYGDEGDECYSLFLSYIGSPRHGVGNVAHQLTPLQFSVIGIDDSRHVITHDELVAAIAETDQKLADDPDYLNASEKWNLERARGVANSNRQYIITGTGSGVVYSATTTQDTASGQELGSTIAAQGNVLIEAGDAKNIVSRISSATGNIEINADTFANVGQGIYERTTYKWGSGIFQNHSSPSVIPLGGGTEVALKATDYAYGTLDAGNKVLISSGVVANGVTERNGILNPPDPAAQQRKVADITALTDGLPSNGLFQANTNPAQNYLVETNPALTNLDTFYGSDYALSRMGFNPNDEANKRLGDGFYETRLVRDQLFELTGRRFLSTSGTDTDQFVELMDNAVQAHSDLNLTVGLSLTADQVAALTDDIVWFEYQEVDGQQVLVPVVYLCSASLDKIAQGGSVIAAGEVKIETTGDTANAGLIASRGQTTITADNFFNNKGTLSGQNVAVTATDSIRNTGGDIRGTDVALTAGKDVVIAAATTEHTNSDTAYTQISKAGGVKAENSLHVEAGRDIGIIGADVQSGGDTTLKADGNVAVSSAETTFHHSASGSDFNTHSDVAINRKSTVTTGGALNIEAGEDVAVHGSELASNGDTTLHAGGSVAITAATDNSELYSHSEGHSGGFFGGKKSTTIDRKEQSTLASKVKSGGSVTVEAGTAGSGDVSLHGSHVKADGDVTLKAEGDIQVTPNQVENYSNFQEDKSGFMNTKSSEQDDARTITNDRPEIEAGHKVALDAKQDVILQSARITSGDETEITAREGQVAMLVSKDSEYKRKVSSNNGFFSWSTKDEGSTDETVQHTEINAGKGLTITTAEGVTVQYKETGDVREDIAQLAQAPGLKWMAKIADRDDVDWQAVQEVHNQWSESDSGVGGPGMQLVSLAMAVALSLTPGGQGVAGALMTTSTGQATAFGAWATSLGIKEGLTAAIAAGFNSLVLQAGTQIIGNGGDIGAALKALASMDTVRSLATTMLTAGLTQGALDRFAKSTLAGRIDGLAKELTKGAISAGINTGVGTAINGGRLDENLIANLRSSAVSVLGAEAARDIGEAYKNNKLDYVVHKIAHAALGGAMAAANGDDIASGAVGGAVGEITGEVLMGQIKEAMLTGKISPKAAQSWIETGVDLSKLAAGFAAAATGGDVDVAASAGGNAARNNSAVAVMETAGALIALAEAAPIVATAAIVLCLAGLVTSEEFNEMLKRGTTSLTAFIKEKYQALTEKQKAQLKIPGYTATEIDAALEGAPIDAGDDVGSTMTTPVNEVDKEQVTSVPASEDQNGQVDDSGVISSSYTPDQLATATRLGVSPKWIKSDGTIDWPPDNGFDGGEYENTTLQPGVLIDRYGEDTGNFLSPVGTSFGERALPAAKENDSPIVYEVIKPLQVKEGKTAAWFDQPGGGTQYETEMSVKELKDHGYIREVK